MIDVENTNTTDSFLKLSKEHMINQIITNVGDSLTKDQLHSLMISLTKTLEDVDFVSQKQSVSTDVINNEYLIKNYFVAKKMSGKQDSTLKCYAYSINRFMEFYNGDLKKVETNHIRYFLLTMQGQNVSNSSVDNMRRNLNAFYQWLEDEEYIVKNPCKRITRIDTKKKAPVVYSDYAMECVRDSCKNIRELAIVDLLISTGLRVDEICNLRLKDIDWDNNQMLIHGKGNKERIVPLSVRGKKHLQDYLNDIKDKGKKEYLFYSTHSKDGRISNNRMGKIVKEIVNRAGYPNITIHSFRKYFASNLNRKGVDPVIIQELLGHDSFNTTQRYYLAKSTNRAKDIVDRFVE